LQCLWTHGCTKITVCPNVIKNWAQYIAANGTRWLG
jgi:hypothetical protein